MEINNLKIEISKEKVLRRLGHKLGNKIDARVDSIINKEIQEAQSLLEIYGIYEDLEIESVAETKIQLKNAFCIDCKNLAKIMENSDKATLLAVTIGDELEKKTDDPTIDLIRDAIGSEAVETFAVKVNELITKRAKLAGYKTLFRFSVGYGGWDIKDQKKILDLLKPKNIKLGEGYIMHPRKSITAIIGWEKIPN